MALVHFEGFETFPYSEMGSFYSGSMGTTMDYGAGRVGGSAVQFSTNPAYFGRGIASTSTVVVGFGFRRGTTDIVNLIRLFEGATEHVRVAFSGSNLVVSRAGATLGSGSFSFAAGAWNYVEIRATIHDTAGSVELRVNGAPDVLVNNVDTRNAGSGVVNEVRWGPQGGATTGADRGSVDDIYIVNLATPGATGFLGDCRAVRLLPNGAGAFTDFTPSAGSNWQNVDEATPNEDTDYNASSTPGAIDTFSLSNLPATLGTVHGVRLATRWRKDDAGARTGRSVLRVGATNYSGSVVGIGDTYTTNIRLVERSPDTAVDWSVAEIDDLEAGYLVES